MLLNTETWSKDVCDLIDYDNEKLITSTLNINSTSYIYRKENNVISYSEKSNKKDEELLFKIRIGFGKKKHLEIIRNKYDLDENDNLINPNPCFFLLKPNKIDPKMNRYKLSPGEIIKIGRITMRIRDIKFKKKLNEKNSQDMNTNNKKEKGTKKMSRLETTESKLNNYEEDLKKKISKKKDTKRYIFQIRKNEKSMSYMLFRRR